jgi:Calcineurin-like phosphoesterase
MAIEDLLRPEDTLLLAGDWHGNFPQADNVIRYAKEHGIKVILQLGDFGIWSNDKPFLNKMQFLLNQWDIHLFFIDGNHEDFTRLYDKKVLENGNRYVRDNITYLQRGYRFNWGDHSFLCLGGAASIDKRFRTKGKSWWPEEYLTEEDILTAQSGGPVDVMFCHDSPAGAPNSITDDNLGQIGAIRYYGSEALNYTNNHRQLLKRVTDVTTPKLLFHGHYHKDMRGFYVHGDEESSVGWVQGLDQGTGRINKHALELTLDSVKESIRLSQSMEYSERVDEYEELLDTI